MPVKALFSAVGFLVSWFVLLPMVIIGGGVALVAGATLAEARDTLFGGSSRVENGNVRDIARRMVAGYGPVDAGR